MTTLSQLDFSGYADGTELDAIDALWVQTGTYALKTSSGRLYVASWGSSAHALQHTGAARWEIDLYALGESSGIMFMAGFGTDGGNYETGVRVQYEKANTRWAVWEGWTLKATCSDDWQYAGATRTLILEWDGAGGLTFTVANGETTVGTQSVSGITTDGDDVMIKLSGNSDSYLSVTIEGWDLTDDASGDTGPLFSVRDDGAFVAAETSVRQSSAWGDGAPAVYDGGW